LFHDIRAGFVPELIFHVDILMLYPFSETFPILFRKFRKT